MATRAALPGVEVALFDDLDALAADAAGAMDAQVSPYHRLGWYRMTRDHVLGATPLVAARARDGDDAAWLLLTAAGEAYASWYSLRVGPVFSGAPRPDLLTAIVRALKPRFAHVALAPMEPADAVLTLGAFRAAGWWTRESEATANWVAHVGGLSFDDYWAARPSRLRNTVKRKAKAAALDIAIHARFDPAAWADYEAIYAASWKPEEGSPAFLRAMVEGAGALRLGIARHAGQPIAAQLWTIDGGTATIHKLAYREDAKALSAGSILGHAMFRHVLTHDRPATIDYGTGDDAYKADWMDERRMLMRVEAWNPRTVGGVARAAKARLLKG
ncbi:GNAT family N-acetyltransferase [Sphingomonas gilva]|uniref:GNAT family N-acetyltransferase n=1 Tax=Sphingomonas gilva TaxID=2305907 RepID=A0A396RQE8_9SPHN|nr:GNAT family N-acetyltransferase [Sphingomonas gilva]RHW18698.1 GNAT family N-acetyltransferase [Sphingomonas gilva]